MLHNGFGCAVIEHLSDQKITTPVVRVGWPDQFVEHGSVPVLRAKDPSLPKAAANAFNRIAWPAYWVLVATGLWNVMAERADAVAASPGWDMVLGIKVLLVALSGVAAFVHTRATTTTGLAVWGALSGLSAIAAVYVGILLAG